MRRFRAIFILLGLWCRFAAAVDLNTLAQAVGGNLSVCAALLMMPHSPLRLKTEDPLAETLATMNAHVHEVLADLERVTATRGEIPNATYELLLDERNVAARTRYVFGDSGPEVTAVLSAARNYFYLRYLGRGYLEFKMRGRLREYKALPGEMGPIDAGRYDQVIGDLLLTEQRVTDLLHAQPGFRAYYRQRRRTHRPGPTEVLDFGTDTWIQRREIFTFNLKPGVLPSALAHLKRMTFSTYTEDHSFSHFAQANRLESLTDALRLARDTVTTVVSTRLTSRDVFQSLHLLVMAAPVPVEVNLEGWAKNQAHGRPMLPLRLTFPSGAEPGAEPFVLGLILCTETPCRVKDLDFNAGELISVFPISGPGVVRIPPARELRRALVHGETLFDETRFKRHDSTPKVLEAH